MDNIPNGRYYLGMKSELVKYYRLLNIALPKKQSAFLWGARKTGKSTYLKTHYPDSIRYDLLQTDLYLNLLKEPKILREEILALPKSALQKPIIIDEVQKIPTLMDEIHWLIENTDAYFILCGSSARKLKTEHANLLGGRAWRYTFYPLVYKEITDFDLLRALNSGLIPSHYLSSDIKRSLKAYVEDYLIHEIKAEGLTRNIPAFARFLDSLAFSHGALLNYSNIARECAIDSKTVKEYYQILIDTLLGYYIFPFRKKRHREIISNTPKFYFVDIGIINILMKRNISSLKGSQAGEAFEHFILMELVAYRGLNNLDFDITFWRTKTGLEVDFILGNGEVAIEIKISDNPKKEDLKGIMAFQEEHRTKKCFVVCLTQRTRVIVNKDKTEIKIIPWALFLQDLWNGNIHHF